MLGQWWVLHGSESRVDFWRIRSLRYLFLVFHHLSFAKKIIILFHSTLILYLFATREIHCSKICHAFFLQDQFSISNSGHACTLCLNAIIYFLLFYTLLKILILMRRKMCSRESQFCSLW